MASYSGSLHDDSGQHARNVLRPLGPLDDAAAEDLREATGRALSRGPATLVIDLSGVTAIDAVGIDALVYASRAATAAHVNLVLSAPTPLVRRLLEPTRLSNLCDFEVETAVVVPIRRTAA
jgi:anti-anti-sigma factor